ncbi:3-carboxy-cis,cis-muconate cycloisomerase [Undibacterium sp.]|jgi:3-carboxy-cis,cis-muconate cycloisomerase|uniref:3-carboxy-cis,cis-muconate cycloisomerase n=1 Tax=Undibacterium sp. TaxID=1914977 RepID=UPI002BEA639E|nr:3-carboxy-cis,cis-muconate cycloisomerase [Undibacterium sp.]HTD03911.1 3-carboxy-cis,cis-muconate cycloisomerase [Undibacterium sp.]
MKNSSSLTSLISSTEPMLAVFSDHNSVACMLDVEAALARAEAGSQVIPAQALAAIEAACEVELIDLASLAHAAASAGNLAIPLVKLLTANVAKADPEAAKYVHWGATSQDVMDTALVLQLRQALDLIDADLLQLNAALAALAERHQHTVMVGRTWMQHALPVTFGMKAAGWLDGMLRHRKRLFDVRQQVLVVQCGGAAGTLASLADKAAGVAAALAEELELGLPAMPWHGQRDRVAEVAAVMGLLVGSLGKMARDISLLSQTDVAEVAEPEQAGRGGSSAMPHKRNPVACAVALAAAVRVPGLVSTMLSGMVQENERALGGWQAEWDTLPDIMRLAAGSLAQMKQVAAGLTVDAARMRRNLDATHGQIMAEAVSLALGRSIGRMAAHQLVEIACRQASSQQKHLREVLAQDAVVAAHLSGAELDKLFDPALYTGQAAAFVDQVLAAWNDQK